MDAITICNLALGMIGMPGIVSFEDANNNAKLCKRFYPVLLDRVLRDHTWSFATASYDLQRLDESSFDASLAYVCALPGDVIRIISVNSSQYPADDAPYRRVGRKVLVRYLPATLVYVRRIMDANEFDSIFIEAMQYLLASEICLSTARDAGTANFYRQEYEKRVALARTIDSQENIHAYRKSPYRSDWLASRRSGCGIPCPPLNFTEGTEGK